MLQDQEKAAKKAAAAAATAWGERQLSPLEAEDKLAVACEKAPTEDPVLAQLRSVFQDLEQTYSEKCNAQKEQVCHPKTPHFRFRSNHFLVQLFIGCCIFRLYCTVFRYKTLQFVLIVHTATVQVTELGGLHVVGTERHESRRIDNQLRGRTGRQGDPGSTRFFLSLEDNIFRIFGGDKIQGLMTVRA